MQFNDKVRPRLIGDKDQTTNTYKSLNAFYGGRELTLNAFKSRVFPLKPTKGKGGPPDLAMQVEILPPKQMFQRLLVALATNRS